MKKCFSIIIFVLMVTLLMNHAGATELKYYGFEVGLSEERADIVMTMKFREPISELNYNLNFRVHNLTVHPTSGSAECESVNRGGASEISCGFGGMRKEKTLVKFNFQSDSGFTELDSKKQYSTNYYAAFPTERIFFLIKLPEKAILSEEVVSQSYYPEDAGILSDGRRIKVYWDKENLKPGDNIQFSVSYISAGFMSDIPLYTYVIAAFAIVVVVVLVRFFIYHKKTVKKQSEAMVSVLNRDEKTLYDILTERGGEASQKVLVRESDFSKAKVSRVVKDLKDRKIIEIEPISGRENKIILKTSVKSPKKEPAEADEAGPEGFG